MRKFTSSYGVAALLLLCAVGPVAAQGVTPKVEFASSGYYVRTYLPDISISDGSTNGEVDGASLLAASLALGSHYGYTGVSDVVNQNDFNMYGFGAQFAANVTDIFGIVGEYSYYRGTPFEEDGFKLEVNGHFYGGGPRVSFRGSDVVTPSFDVLFGGYRLNASAEFNGQDLGSEGQNGWAVKAGGQLDWRVNDYFRVRLPGVHWMRIDVANEGINNLVISFGANFVFGDRQD